MRNPTFRFHPHCRDLGLTNLMFADDLILFNKADPTSLKIIMGAFGTFHDTTGLKSNPSKSQIVIRGASTTVQRQCPWITGLSVVQFAIKYLCIPITAT